MTNDVRVNKWDRRFIEVCALVASWSKDPSTKCGCVITKNVNKFISLGYNGYPANVRDTQESLTNREEKYEKIIHAEVNGILAAKQDLTGCALYVWPMPPCSRCMTVIIQAGISRVVSVIPSTEALQRWGDNFILSSQMAEEAGVELKLIADPFSKTKFDIFNQIHSLLKK